MGWTAPATWVAGAVLTAAQLIEQVRDNELVLSTHVHAANGSGDGASSLGPLVLADFTTAAAPAAPGASKGRFYVVTSDRPGFRSGAAGAAEVLATLSTAQTWTALQSFGTNLGGTLQTAAQPNVTSLGTLTGLTMGGNIAMGAFNITNVTQITLPPSTGNIAATALTGGWHIYGGTSAANGVDIVLFSTGSNSATFYLYTPNAASSAGVLRFSVTGIATTAVATWADVTHTGITLSGQLNTAGQTLTSATSWVIEATGASAGLTIRATGTTANLTFSSTNAIGFSISGSGYINMEGNFVDLNAASGLRMRGTAQTIRAFNNTLTIAGANDSAATRNIVVQTNDAAGTGLVTRLTWGSNAATVALTWAAAYHVALKYGLAGTATGAFTMDGATSGVVTVTVAATAGTWTMTLPTSAGSAGQVLRTDGAGVTSWVTRAGVVFYPHDPSRNQGAATVAADSAVAGHYGGAMVDAAKRSTTYNGKFEFAPASVKLVVIPAATGNMAWYCTSAFAAVGEARATHTDSLGSDGTPQTTAVTATIIAEIDITDAFTGALAGDYFGLDFVRDGDDAADTVGDTVIVLGLLVTY